MSELSGQDLAAIQEIHDRWLSAELRGDHSQVIELCTDDVSWIPPNEPPLNGKEAIAQYLTESTVELKDIRVKDVVIRGNGTVAYLTSTYHTRFMLAGGSEIQEGNSEIQASGSAIQESGSEVQEATGTHLWILRRTEDGSWRVAIVSWSYWQSAPS